MSPRRSRPAHEDASSSRPDRCTVLFADADSRTRFAYHAVASAAGFGVELASDGYEAVALASIVVPDVIVLDTLLAGYDGFEVIRLLRADERLRSTPILIVSSEDGARYDAAVKASGCDAHLVKPCTAKDLLQLVQVLWVGSRARATDGARVAPPAGPR